MTEPTPAPAPLHTTDSFVNFMTRLGMGGPGSGLPGMGSLGGGALGLNTNDGANYIYNTISKQQQTLEQIYRSSWLIGKAVDVPAEDMTKEGVRFTGSMPPKDMDALYAEDQRLQTWPKFKEAIAWGRLYGGALAVPLLDGQLVDKPLNLDRVGRDSYKGLTVFDRWMVDPITSGLVQELGPDLGKPEYYRVTTRAPVYVGSRIHYSRTMRFDGIWLPYQQRLVENEWSMSIVERIYDRLVAFDSATAGASALVNKAHLRTLAIDGLRDIIAQGSAPGGGELFDSLVKNIGMIAFFQGLQGITLLDGADRFETHQYAFSGLADVLMQFGQQMSGSLDVPLVVLFGQSPAGLNSTGESDFRMHYDRIRRAQRTHLLPCLLKHYTLMSKSLGIRLPPDFGIEFPSLWNMTLPERVDTAGKVAAMVGDMFDKGIISQRMALQELRQQSRETGIFTNITDENIEEADDSLLPDPPPVPAASAGELPAPEDIDGKPHEPGPGTEPAPEERTARPPRPRPVVAPEA